MFDGRFIIRAFGAGALAAAFLLGATPAQSAPKHARAKGGDNACMAAYRSAQQHEHAGHLREARDSLLACAKSACGTFIQQNCANRYAQLSGDIPTIIPVVLDDGGAPRVDVEVRVDGEVIATTLDGRALSLDPGLRELTFSADSHVFDTQKLMIVQGQRNRVVSASLHDPKGPRKRTAVAETLPAAAADAPEAAPAAAPAHAPPRVRAQAPAIAADDQQAGDADEPPGAGKAEGAKLAPRRSSPLDAEPAASGGGSKLALALGAAGLASAGAGALLIYWGRGDNDMLGQCAPNCPKASVDHIRRLYLAGDIALGAGAVALLGAVWAYAVSGPDPEEAHAKHAVMFGVQPARAGAVASFSGRF